MQINLQSNNRSLEAERFGIIYSKSVTCGLVVKVICVIKQTEGITAVKMHHCVDK
jgi:hypothetical protein